MHTSFACGLRCFRSSHCRIVSVAPWRLLSTHDWLSETMTTRSAFARSVLSFASGALTFVPPPPIEASFVALVITESRGFSWIATTRSSNGTTRAFGFARTIAAAKRAATSMQRTAEVARQAEELHRHEIAEALHRIEQERRAWEQGVLRQQVVEQTRVTEELAEKAEELARTVAEREAAERVTAPLKDQVPDRYSESVIRYYQSLSRRPETR